MDRQKHEARIIDRTRNGYSVGTTLGRPSFEAKNVPVKSRHRYLINSPLRIGGVDMPVTCLSVGNPHAVLIVNDFEFDWQTLGYEIEHHRAFPERTNVEFVKVVSRKRLEVADWERGAGATGSSGTGAAAAVCAAAMLGMVQRRCRVDFGMGSLMIDWRDDDVIELTGPVAFVAQGEFDY
jgi:diaminopimelate epimerase